MTIAVKSVAVSCLRVEKANAVMPGWQPACEKETCFARATHVVPASDVVFHGACVYDCACVWLCRACYKKAVSPAATSAALWLGRARR